VKKLVAIFFLVLYGFASIGATVHTHYCMGEYVGTTLLKNKDSKCGKCGMKESNKKNGCCKDEHQEYKLKVDQQKSNVADFIHAFFVPVDLLKYNNYTIVKLQVTKLCYSNYHPPPDIHNQNLQVLYCTFLI
jgi:hypothetical protein